MYFNIIFKYELIFTSWRARCCPWNKKRYLSVHKKFQPNRSSRLASYMQFYRWRKVFFSFLKGFFSSYLFSTDVFFSSTEGLIDPPPAVYCSSADGLFFLCRKFMFLRWWFIVPPSREYFSSADGLCFADRNDFSFFLCFMTKIFLSLNVFITLQL